MQETTQLIKLTNCQVLRGHQLIIDDLWIRNGSIIDAEVLFWQACRGQASWQPVQVLDCKGLILVPGYIDSQINGAFGVDFSRSNLSPSDLDRVASQLVQHGVTSFCPTVISCSRDVYQEILSLFEPRWSCGHKASILGAHLEGPFINNAKYGAHPKNVLRDLKRGIVSLEECYGPLEDVARFVKVITLAPELEGALDCIELLQSRLPETVISLGHSLADLNTSSAAVSRGASMITHLFNAMVPFHHRDPGIVGLLGVAHRQEAQAGGAPRLFYGLIADGIHTHPASIRIAYATHPKGCVLVTDAMQAMGLPTNSEGLLRLGDVDIQVENGNTAKVSGTDVLAGSIARLDECVRIFRQASGSSLVRAVECASLHVAQMLKLDHIIGKLEPGFRADLILVDSQLQVHATIIAGQLAWLHPETRLDWTVSLDTVR